MDFKFEMKLEDKSAQYLDELEKKAEKAMRKVANRRVKIMKAMAPVDEGKLRDGYRYKLTKSHDEISVEVGGTDWKTHWYEWGTIKLHGLHIVEMAFSDFENEFNKEFIEQANKIKDLV